MILKIVFLLMFVIGSGYLLVNSIINIQKATVEVEEANKAVEESQAEVDAAMEDLEESFAALNARNNQ